MKLLIIEGPDGSGKSTIVKELAKQLVEEGVKVRQDREPTSDAVRAVLNSQEDPLAKLLTFLGDRADHIRQMKEWEAEGAEVVVLDRFSLSTYVNQMTQGLPERQVVELIWEVDRTIPSDWEVIYVVLLQELPVLLERMKGRGKPDMPDPDETTLVEHLEAYTLFAQEDSELQHVVRWDHWHACSGNSIPDVLAKEILASLRRQLAEVDSSLP